MDSFKFRLQKVLDIKVKNEYDSKIQYSKAQSEKKIVEERLRNLEDDYEKYSNSIDIGDMVQRRLTSNYLYYLSNHISNTNSELDEKEKILGEAKLDLLNKQIERKSLETLKDNKYKLYKKLEQYREQAINDEYGMYSYIRSKAESNLGA